MKFKAILLLAAVTLLLVSCGKSYHTIYQVKAKQIIRGKSFINGYEEHVISDSLGNVYRVFGTPKSKQDSVYHLNKRLSYNRERSLQFYYKHVNN